MYQRCPVCNGNGLVSAGFYSHAGNEQYYTTLSTAPEKCLTCDGKGIIKITTGTVDEPLRAKADDLATRNKLWPYPDGEGCKQ